MNGRDNHVRYAFRSRHQDGDVCFRPDHVRSTASSRHRIWNAERPVLTRSGHSPPKPEAYPNQHYQWAR